MKSIEQAEEIVRQKEAKHLDGILEQAEAWKKCGCHKCMLEAGKQMEKYNKEYLRLNQDFSLEEDFLDEEVKELLTAAKIVEEELSGISSVEELETYININWKAYRNVLVCFKLNGEEIWVYYDKDARPNLYGGRD